MKSLGIHSSPIKNRHRRGSAPSKTTPSRSLRKFSTAILSFWDLPSTFLVFREIWLVSSITPTAFFWKEWTSGAERESKGCSGCRLVQESQIGNDVGQSSWNFSYQWDAHVVVSWSGDALRCGELYRDKGTKTLPISEKLRVKDDREGLYSTKLLIHKGMCVAKKIIDNK